MLLLVGFGLVLEKVQLDLGCCELLGYSAELFLFVIDSCCVLFKCMPKLVDLLCF